MDGTQIGFLIFAVCSFIAIVSYAGTVSNDIGNLGDDAAEKRKAFKNMRMDVIFLFLLLMFMAAYFFDILTIAYVKNALLILIIGYLGKMFGEKI